MRNGSWIAIVVGFAIVAAALVGWRGSRPTSPTAASRSDGVTVVPATGTLRREDVVPAAAPAAAPSPARSSPAPDPAVTAADLDPEKPLADRFAAESRDSGWAPGAEASARAAVADVPHLAGPMEARCAATLCRVTGAIPGGLPADQANEAMQAIQGRAMERLVRGGPFRDGSAGFRSEPGGRTTVTLWLVRR